MGKAARFSIEFEDMKKSPKSPGVESDEQAKMFVEAARDLECDESEERFDRALRKIAAHKPLSHRPNEREDDEQCNFSRARPNVT